MSSEPQPLITYKQIAVTLVVLALAFAGYQVKKYMDASVVDAFVRQTPVLQLVLTKHPKLYPSLIQRFTEPYKVAGDDGLNEVLSDTQQLLTTSFLSDYVWQVKDKPLKVFLKSQYALVVALQKNKDAVKARLCERYFTDSSLSAEVEKSVGHELMTAYLSSVDGLFLSAREGALWPVTSPTDPAYKVKLSSALQDLMTGYKKLYPKDTRTNFYRYFNPAENCGLYAAYLYTLLLVKDNWKQSLLWRSTLEYNRAKMEARHKLLGSE